MRLRERQRRPEVNIDDLLPRFLADGHAADRPVDWAEPEDLERLFPVPGGPP